MAGSRLLAQLTFVIFFLVSLLIAFSPHSFPFAWIAIVQQHYHRLHEDLFGRPLNHPLHLTPLHIKHVLSQYYSNFSVKHKLIIHNTSTIATEDADEGMSPNDACMKSIPQSFDEIENYILSNPPLPNLHFTLVIISKEASTVDALSSPLFDQLSTHFEQYIASLSPNNMRLRIKYVVDDIFRGSRCQDVNGRCTQEEIARHAEVYEMLSRSREQQCIPPNCHNFVTMVTLQSHVTTARNDSTNDVLVNGQRKSKFQSFHLDESSSLLLAQSRIDVSDLVSAILKVAEIQLVATFPHPLLQTCRVHHLDETRRALLHEIFTLIQNLVLMNRSIFLYKQLLKESSLKPDLFSSLLLGQNGYSTLNELGMKVNSTISSDANLLVSVEKTRELNSIYHSLYALLYESPTLLKHRVDEHDFLVAMILPFWFPVLVPVIYGTVTEVRRYYSGKRT